MVSNKGISKLPGAPYFQVQAVNSLEGDPPLAKSSRTPCTSCGLPVWRRPVAWPGGNPPCQKPSVLAWEKVDVFVLWTDDPPSWTVIHVPPTQLDSARKVSSTQKKVPAVMGYGYFFVPWRGILVLWNKWRCFEATAGGGEEKDLVLTGRGVVGFFLVKHF